MDAIPRIDDAAYVAAEYADDARLSGRAALWSAWPVRQPLEIALKRIAQLAPASALEVGCGQGAFAAALAARGIAVTATDRSARMVALTAARGVPARPADVSELPFGDGSFALVAANYMLYHVPDVPRAIAELARVLEPGGTLVAVTNGDEQLQELWELVGREREPLPFSSENGRGLLEASFAGVERIDVTGRFTVTEAAVRGYVAHTRFAALGDRVPALPDGLTVTGAGSVFVATR